MNTLSLTKPIFKQCQKTRTDLSDQGGCISAQTEQHVASLALSVISQQLQKL